MSNGENQFDGQRLDIGKRKMHGGLNNENCEYVTIDYGIKLWTVRIIQELGDHIYVFFLFMFHFLGSNFLLMFLPNI